MDDILKQILGDKPERVERYFNLTAITQIVTASALVVLVILKLK